MEMRWELTRAEMTVRQAPHSLALAQHVMWLVILGSAADEAQPTTFRMRLWSIHTTNRISVNESNSVMSMVSSQAS